MRLSFRYNSLEGLGFTLFSDPNPIAIYMKERMEERKGGMGGKGEKGEGVRWKEEKEGNG